MNGRIALRAVVVVLSATLAVAASTQQPQEGAETGLPTGVAADVDPDAEATDTQSATPADPDATGVEPGSAGTGEAEAASAEAASGAPEAQFDLKVKSLEERVTDLKEKILQTKARLLLLQETVIAGDLTSGAKAVLIHRNEMGSTFVLESVQYALDGAPIFSRVDTSGELDEQAEIEIFNGRIVPGQHQITVRMVFRGSGYGLFSYLNDYKFRVQSSYTINVEGGKVTEVKIVAYEQGGITADLKDRPEVKYEEEVTREGRRRPQEGTPQASSEGER